MLERLYQAFTAAVLMNDTEEALRILKSSSEFLLEPLQGPLLHARFLYYAMKCKNEVLAQYLLKMPVFSDIAFYQYCGESPISLAVSLDFSNLYCLIINHTDKYFALGMAYKFHNQKVIDLLLQRCIFPHRFLEWLQSKPKNFPTAA